MRKVTYLGGLFTYDDVKNFPFPEKYVRLVEIEASDEKEAKEKYISERIKKGTLHPFPRFVAK